MSTLNNSPTSTSSAELPNPPRFDSRLGSLHSAAPTTFFKTPEEIEWDRGKAAALKVQKALQEEDEYWLPHTGYTCAYSDGKLTPIPRRPVAGALPVIHSLPLEYQGTYADHFSRELDVAEEDRKERLAKALGQTYVSKYTAELKADAIEKYLLSWRMPPSLVPATAVSPTPKPSTALVLYTPKAD